jgi:hypothetical protein
MQEFINHIGEITDEIEEVLHAGRIDTIRFMYDCGATCHFIADKNLVNTFGQSFRKVNFKGAAGVSHGYRCDSIPLDLLMRATDDGDKNQYFEEWQLTGAVYSPHLRYNILSHSTLLAAGFKTSEDFDRLYIPGRHWYADIILEDKLFWVDFKLPRSHDQLNTRVNYLFYTIIGG